MGSISSVCIVNMDIVNAVQGIKMKKQIDTQDVMKLDDATQKKIIQQYEDIRQSGLTNMFDYTTVKFIANELLFDALLDFIKNDMKCYRSILKNFSTLMKKFDIKQN